VGGVATQGITIGSSEGENKSAGQRLTIPVIKKMCVVFAVFHF
jgi:hypothetical protein